MYYTNFIRIPTTTETGILYKLDEEEYNIFFNGYIYEKHHNPSPFKIYKDPFLYMEDTTMIVVPENIQTTNGKMEDHPNCRTTSSDTPNIS